MTTMRQLIKGSMRLINALGLGEEPTDAEMQVALSSLNGLVDSLGNDILNIYTVQPYYFPLTPGKQFYTLGPATINGVPTGADWMTTRPMRIEQARLLLYPTIAYPTPPGPVNTCAYVCSEQDEDTTDLWHFDEEPGTAIVTPAISFTPTYIETAGIFELTNTCCIRGLRPAGTDPGEQSFFQQYNTEDGPGVTIEMLLYLDGDEVPTTEIFRTELFSYSNGEGVSIIRAYRDGNDIVFYRSSIGGTELGRATLQQGCNAICIQAQSSAYVSLYVNGVRVFNGLAGSIWSFGDTPVIDTGMLYFVYDLAEYTAQLTLDELRRSNLVRYEGETYEYLRGE